MRTANRSSFIFREIQVWNFDCYGMECQWTFQQFSNWFSLAAEIHFTVFLFTVEFCLKVSQQPDWSLFSVTYFRVANIRRERKRQKERNPPEFFGYNLIYQIVKKVYNHVKNVHNNSLSAHLDCCVKTPFLDFAKFIFFFFIFSISLIVCKEWTKIIKLLFDYALYLIRVLF